VSSPFDVSYLSLNGFLKSLFLSFKPCLYRVTRLNCAGPDEQAGSFLCVNFKRLIDGKEGNVTDRALKNYQGSNMQNHKMDFLCTLVACACLLLAIVKWNFKKFYENHKNSHSFINIKSHIFGPYCQKHRTSIKT
jgi:hypothetical protein